jgi:hypothetical protein
MRAPIRSGRGQAAVEYVAFFPLLFALALVFFNAFVAVTAKTSAQDAARAAANARASGDSAYAAAAASLPGWLDGHLEDVDVDVRGDLVSVEVELSVPTAGSLFVSDEVRATATFEEN